MKFLPLIWSGLWRKPGRTVLALAQILVAFALFGLLQGMTSGAKQAIANSDADLLWVHGRVSLGDPLPLADLARIAQVPGVKMVNLQNYMGAIYRKPSQSIPVLATNNPGDWLTTQGVLVTAPAQLAAMARTRTGALVGRGLMRKYGWKIGERLPLKSDVPHQDGSTDWVFDIVGVVDVKPGESNDPPEFVLINNSYYNEARLSGKNMVQGYRVRVSDPAQTAVVADAIDRVFANSPNETRSESLREVAQAQMSTIGNFEFIVRAVTIAVLFSVLFSIAAAQMQGLRERTPELAVLKTLGFSDATVVGILISEALLLCLVSAALGLALARLLFPTAERAIHIGGLALPVSVLAAGAGLALLLALLSVALPAWRALRLQVAQALAGR